MRLFATLVIGILTMGQFAHPVMAQSGPLRIEITDGVIEPMPYAVPDFVAETPGSNQVSKDISRVIAADLNGTGLFREIRMWQRRNCSQSSPEPAWTE